MSRHVPSSRTCKIKKCVLPEQHERQPNADFLKAKFGDKVQLESFDEDDAYALFVDFKFNLVIDRFVQSLSR